MRRSTGRSQAHNTSRGRRSIARTRAGAAPGESNEASKLSNSVAARMERAAMSHATLLRMQVGDKAPDFSMVGSDGKTYSLASLKGKTVVLAWFPKAFTGGCTAQCNSLRASGELIREFDVAYFMASTDTPEENKGFAEKEHADFPILSDPGKQVAIAYGVVTPERQLPMRHTFYIGPDGRILFIDTAVKAAAAAEGVVAKLGELGVKKK